MRYSSSFPWRRLSQAVSFPVWFARGCPTPVCDRPGCHEPHRKSVHQAACYCSRACREAVRRVRDRPGPARRGRPPHLKAAVLNGSGRSACYHPEFLALCGYFCLQPVACARRDPESKGVVEGAVRYVTHNALARRADQLLRLEDYLTLAPTWRD